MDLPDLDVVWFAMQDSSYFVWCSTACLQYDRTENSSMYLEVYLAGISDMYM